MEADEPIHTTAINAEIARKIASGELLLRENPARSKVWRIFSKVVNKEGEIIDYVYCRSCAKVYKCCQNQTSNLIRHKCYYTKFVNTEDETSTVEEEAPSPVVEIGKVTQTKLNKLLTKWMMQKCRSCDLMLTDGLKAIFKEFFRLGAKFGGDIDLDKLLPSLSDVSENISNVYKRNHELIKAEIALVKDNGYALATDIWIDDLMQESYISVTIHYLKNSEVTCRLLGFQKFEGGKLIRNENITETVQTLLEKFDCQLSNKCIFVRDATSHIVNTLPDSQNLPCISQLLSSTLLKSVEKVPQASEVINACSKLTNFLKKKSFSALSHKLSHKSYHNRCLAIYKMLNSLLINYNEIELALKNMNETKNFTVNKSKVMAITRVFQPFAEAIETLEDDSYATLHLVMAYMHELKKFCHTTIDEYSHFGFITSLQKNILLNLEENVMKNITTLHKIAVFLYPPTNKLLPYSDKEKKSMEDECMRLLKCYKIETKPLIKQELDDDTPLATMCKRRKLLADFLESETYYDTNEIIKQEIQNYKNTRVVFSSNFNVFNWWEVQKENFPLLYKLSCTVLATPATTAASKRVISNAKCLLSEKLRQDTTEADIERIMFISTNAPGVQLDQYFTV